MDVLPPQVMFKSDFENAKIMREDGCANYQIKSDSFNLVKPVAARLIVAGENQYEQIKFLLLWE
jgi:hypothetical protein